MDLAAVTWAGGERVGRGGSVWSYCRYKSEQLNFTECAGIRHWSEHFACTLCILFNKVYVVIAL